MTQPVWALATALLLCYSGAAALALAMDRHHEPWRGRPARPPEAWLLRGTGIAGWTAAMGVCIAAWPATVGTVIWFGLWSAGAIGWTMLYAWSARAARQVALASALGAVLLVSAAPVLS